MILGSLSTLGMLVYIGFLFSKLPIGLLKCIALGLRLNLKKKERATENFSLP